MRLRFSLRRLRANLLSSLEAASSASEICKIWLLHFGAYL